MNIRVKAALITAGLLSISLVAVALLHFAVSNLTADQLATLVGAGFFGFMIYILYSITLSRLEFDQKIKEMRNQK